jgi:hypothetical protein
VVGQLALANGHDINGLMFGVKSGDPDRMFRIMGDGSITLARPVDREQREEYHLEVRLFLVCITMHPIRFRFLCTPSLTPSPIHQRRF